jgi:PAS domain S-box-containing protein
VLYRRGDGREAWLRLVASPIRDAGGRISGAVVAALDIDNKRRAQQALQQLNESLEAQVRERTAERDRMWRLSTDLMLVATFVGEIEAVNPAWENMLGWSEDQLVGSSFMTLVHPEDVEDTLAEMASLERGVTTFRFTNRYRCADGDYRWISWTAVPGDDRIHAVGRDITSERQAAAELEHAQEALRQSQKLEAMGQLTGGVAHDFNNLLSPIIGGLDLLQRREFGDERAKRTIAGALASAERAKTLVQRLLAFARRQPLQPTAVDVGATIRGMAGLLGSTLGPRIDLRVHIPDELPPARADANQLEMALLNLTVNARDAMPEGGELHIHASHESHPPLDRSVGPGEYVRIVVRDTGKGMDEDTLARCIEPFFSTKGVGQGTGLGLSMVHGLAAQLSGALRIDSVPGQGTSIELWLPTTDAATRETGNQVDAPAIKAAGRALVVDDEELVRASTAEMLEELGYETVEAASASDALGLLEQKTFDLLVTDHLMPGMTGTELAGRVRERFKGTKVLIVSGYAEADGLDPSYTRLTKPFRQAELATALSE